MMKHTIDMYTTRGQMCDAMQKEIDNLEAELADKNNEIGNVILPAHCARNNLTSMRDAIDAAMKEVKK